MLTHNMGYVLMGVKIASVGVFVDATTGETELKCIDIKGNHTIVSSLRGLCYLYLG
jgi:hypothetical protein